MGDTVGLYQPVRRIGDFRAKRFDYVSDTLAYWGMAAPGAAAGDPVWQIRRLASTPEGDLNVEWADGNAEFDNVWNDRASLSYS